MTAHAQVVVPLDAPSEWGQSVRFNRKLPIGYRLTVLNATSDDLHQSAIEAFRLSKRRANLKNPAAAKLILSFACASRFQKFEREKAGSWWQAVEALTQNYVSDIPIICSLCAGEYGEDHRLRARGDNFSIWIACLTGEPSDRAKNRLLQNDLLRAADKLIRAIKPDEIMAVAVQAVIDAGATGAQISLADPKSRKILGENHGFAASSRDSAQTFEKVSKFTCRELPDPNHVFCLPDYFTPWTLQLAPAPPTAVWRQLRPEDDILSIVAANKIAIFIPDFN